MPRNGAGTATPPAGNPVVSGTTITSTWGNDTVDDIYNELSNSLAKDGQTTPTANLPMGGYRHTGVGDSSSLTSYPSTKQLLNNLGEYCPTVGGSANAITCAPAVAITAYSAGQRFCFIAGSTNSGATTLNVSSLGAKDIKRPDNAALVGDEITSGQMVSVVYNGTYFELQNMGLMWGNGGKQYKWVAGALRQTTAGGGWALIDDANHKPVNCTGAITVDTNGDLKVEYGFTSSNISGFLVGVDETFAELGVQVGASVGNSLAIFRAYAQYGGAFGVNGVANQTSLGQILNIAPYATNNNQIVDATNGWITVMHDSIAHASSNGPAVATSVKGIHGFFDVTSTKTSFTLRYKRNCSGVVLCPGSVPTMWSKSYVIPSFTPVTISTSANSSGLVLVTTSSDHGLYNDAPVIIAGHSVAGYNGTWNITVQSKTSFLLQGLTYSSAGTGGTVALGYTDWPYAGPWTVSTVTNSGGLQKVTTTAAHGLVTGMAVTVAGVATATTANGNWHITVIDSTSFTLKGSTYAVDGSGGTVTLPEVCFVTDHMAVNHPYAGADNPVVLTKIYSATQSYSVELGTVTNYGFKVYFKDTASKAVITSVNTEMGFNFQRDVRLPATISATIGAVSRDNVHCNMNSLYSSNGNFWFIGLFEV